MKRALQNILVVIAILAVCALTRFIPPVGAVVILLVLAAFAF